MSLRLVFMGTPDFAVPTLARLLEEGHEVAAVYSQPPRPAGRGMAERLSPVHAFAFARGLEVRTPVTLRSESEIALFRGLAADAAVVAAYGLLLPSAILDGTRLGAYNVHASLLPRWRGAAPINRAIMAGDAETGVSIMRMEEGLDAGPVCLARAVRIGEETTAGAMHDELAALGSELMAQALARLEAGTLACSAQPGEGATYAKKIDKSETRIDFSRPAREVLRHIHGLSPHPGAWFALPLGGRTVRVKALKAALSPGSGKPGTAIADDLTVACGSGGIRILELQREGKAPMPATAFLRGTPVAAGADLSGPA